jgi:hypothetical protein
MLRRKRDTFKDYTRQSMLPPREMVRRFYVALLAIVAAIAAIGAGIYLLSGLHSKSQAVRWAEETLTQTVPAFAGMKLKPVAGEANGSPMADLLGPRGEFLGHVTVTSDTEVAVLLTRGPWEYRPATADEVNRLLATPPLGLDQNVLRLVRHAVGGLMMLWPGLAKGSVTLDKIEAVTATADRATLDFGIEGESGHMGAAVEVDVLRRRVVRFSLRPTED